MKKTFNINVAGFPFVIDEDAYTLLNNYLKTIEHAFRNVDGASELINDIESRVAEILLSCTEDGSPIITLSDVEQLIARVGKPEEFAETESFTVENENGTSQTIDIETETTTPPPYIPPLPTTSKRLYRDPQNAMIGGVCSGLAWYLGWDVTWVRILFIGLTVFSYTSFILVYLVLWIVVPEARTPLQRMQMMGEQPTMENIGKTVTDNFKEDRGERVNPQPTSAPPVANILANGASILAKIAIIFGLCIGIPILIAMAVGLIGCIVFLIAWMATIIFGQGMPFQYADDVSPYVSKIIFWSVLCGIGWIITLGIPLTYLIRRGLNYNPLTRNARLFLNIVWGIGFILAGISTGMVIAATFDNEEYRYRPSKTEWINQQIESEQQRETITVEETATDSTLIADTIKVTD